MIGFYDYTLILTLLGLVSAVFGTVHAISGHVNIAILCLLLSGICDAFDGMVARTKKNRTRDEKSFGIQLDSLCDMAAFGVFPVVICHLLGVRGWLGCIAMAYYCVCSVIRLSYYNVMEINRMQKSEPEDKVYYGLPITSVTMILPTFFVLRPVLSEAVFSAVLTVMLILTGTCFILNFKIRRPKKLIPVGLLVISAVVVCEVLFLSFGSAAAMRFGEAWRYLFQSLRTSV